jgi:hypothetical protein
MQALIEDARYGFRMLPEKLRFGCTALPALPSKLASYRRLQWLR